ncbi:serine/threonine-protein kinase 33-like isoform X2 [Diabrotica undecimpunctata]
MMILRYHSNLIVSRFSSRHTKNGLKERYVKHIKLEDLKKLFQVFEFKDQIGHGSFGVVVKAIEKSTSKQYAIKIINKYNVSANLQEIHEEIKILKFVSHPNIIFLDRVYETSKKIYLVFELCGETLFNKFKNSSQFPEKITKKLSKQIIDAVIYLHKHDIVHRDIKMENILFATNPEDPNDEYFIKLSDFGLSVIKVGSGIKGMMTDRVGTILYMSPEILLDHTYSELCDEWSIGVIIYTLIFGRYPFHATNKEDLMIKICETEPEYPIKTAGSDCIDLLKSSLKKDPVERITALEMSKHPWFGSTVQRRKDQTVIDYMKQWKSEMMTISSSHYSISGIPIVQDELLTVSDFDVDVHKV